MRISILADSGPSRGLGHVARCLGLAQGIEARSGVRPDFYVQDTKAQRWLRERGFEAKRSTPVWSDYLIVDSYHQTRASLTRLQKRAGQFLLIDDFGRPSGRPDWILNSAPLANSLPYPRRNAKRLLLGPRYHPLRCEYWDRASPRAVRNQVHQILVLLGGGDAGALLRRVLGIVHKVAPDVICQVVLGPLSRARFSVKAGTKVVISPKSLRPFLEKSDVVVTGAGQSLYEVAWSGLPAVCIRMAANQSHNVAAFQKSGTVLSAGSPEDAGFDGRLEIHLRRLMTDKSLRTRMAQAGRRLIDGWGAFRVARTILPEARAA